MNHDFQCQKCGWKFYECKGAVQPIAAKGTFPFYEHRTLAEVFKGKAA